MVLQSSGPISFSNIQTEFGGANPIGSATVDGIIYEIIIINRLLT